MAFLATAVSDHLKTLTKPRALKPVWHLLHWRPQRQISRNDAGCGKVGRAVAQSQCDQIRRF